MKNKLLFTITCIILLGGLTAALTYITDTQISSDASLVNFSVANLYVGGSVNTTGVININNADSANALKILQVGNTSASVSVGGAILLTNTGNDGAGIIVYSNHGASATGRLMNLKADNAAFDQDVFHIDNDGVADALSITTTDRTTTTSNAISISYVGVGNAVVITNTGTNLTNAALSVSSTNNNESSVSISGNETRRGTVKITHKYSGLDDSNAAILSLDATGLGTASQGIFMTSTGNTTGDLMDIRNYGFQLMRLDDYGMFQLYINHSAFTCNIPNGGSIYFDNSTKKHYGCNTTDWNALY